MFFADAVLARRIEAAEAAIARGCTLEPLVLEVAGGCAVFAGADSPLTQVVGVGLCGCVSDPELDAMEHFFRSRGAPVKIDLCPLADPGLVELLAARGYSVSEFNNTLVRKPDGVDPPPSPRVRLAERGEADLWAEVVGRGFFEQPSLTAEETDVGRAIAAMPGVACYLAWEDGQAVAGAALAVSNGVATFFSDGAVVGFRRRGLQRELIAARLRDALARGCDLAAASTFPGSASQRNYERLGFEVVYTKVTLIGPIEEF